MLSKKYTSSTSNQLRCWLDRINLLIGLHIFLKKLLNHGTVLCKLHVCIENFPFLIQSDCLFHQCFIYKGLHLALQNSYSNTSDSDFWGFPACLGIMFIIQMSS